MSCRTAWADVPPAERLIVDGFAGPGGWSQGLRMLGLHDVGLEWDTAACKTRAAAGHLTIQCDIAQYPTAPFTGRIWGGIFSPPCQAWSRAGKGLGLVDQPLVRQAVTDLARGRDTRAELLAQCRDKRSLLAAEPVRWLRDLRPEWVAMEEVPDVLPLFRQIAEVLRGWGYSVWVGVLNAADYGVPQTRRRAILIASRARRVSAPEPTHAEQAEDAGLFGPGRARWVSMAEALGWGATDRTAPTVTAGGGKTGGPEPFPTQARQSLLDAQERGAWVLRTGNNSMKHSRSGSRRGEGGVVAYERGVGEPAPTLDTNVGNKWRLGDGVSPDTVRIAVQEAAVLQSFPADYPWQGTKTKQFEQVGNAVPPLLAAHVLSAATGVPLDRPAVLPAAA